MRGGGSGEFYALHTTLTVTPAETEGGNITTTFSNVELREDGLPMWLIIDNYHTFGTDRISTRVMRLQEYDDDTYYYDSHIVNRSTGEVTDDIVEPINPNPGGGNVVS